VRGTLAGSLTAVLALAFHVFGGGAVPDAAAIVGSLLAAVWICTMLAGRRIRAWLLVVAITVAQVVLHTIFSMATATVVVASSDASHGAHQHDDAVIASIAHGGHAMWAAHAAAGAVTVLGILFGDRVLTALAQLGSTVFARILVAFTAPVPISTHRSPLPVAPVIISLSDRAISLVARRGPPAFVPA
jgi:hypothetical protein